MAATIQTNGDAVNVGKPAELFSTRVANTPLYSKQQYAVSRDGRFLIIQPAEGSVTPAITLILNRKLSKGERGV